MTRDQATELLLLLADAFPQLPVEEGTVGIYQDQLLGYEYDDARNAAEWCIRRMKRFPTVADLRETIALIRRDREHNEERERRRPVPDRIYEKGIPTWVKVWAWAREVRDPVERRIFPQLVGASDPDTGRPMWTFPPDAPLMTVAEYDRLELEWREAGEPRVGLVAPLDPRGGVKVGGETKQVPA